MPASMKDIRTLLQAGIDPITNLPLKLGTGKECNTKQEMRKLFRIIDEQDAVNRYEWTNLPLNMSSQELERLLYYKGQLCFFYNKDLNEFFFMPYALNGTIDFYGRFNTIHPVPMTSGTTENDKKRYAQQLAYLSTLKLDCVYGPLVYEPTEDQLLNSTVLLFDYTRQLAQVCIPRYELQEPLLDIMSECIPYLRTYLAGGTGVKGVKVNDADEAQNVQEANRNLKDAALTGDFYVPIIAKLDLQELTESSNAKSEEYLETLQALDNLRLSLYGLENGGLFQKKAQMLDAEQAMNKTKGARAFDDGLAWRQHFCNIVNSIWGLGIWCQPKEVSVDVDLDGDGQELTNDYDNDSSGMEENYDDDSEV